MEQKSAVLVIDVQQGLCEGEGRAWESDRVIACINLVTQRARAGGAPVIFIQHESGSGYLTHGSAQWQLAAGLHAAPQDLRVRKTTPDTFLRTDLQEILQRHGVTHLVICGMHSEFCVDSTTRRALALGFAVTLVEDGHTSAGNAGLSARQVIAHHNATLTNIASFGSRAHAIPGEDIRFGT